LNYLLRDHADALDKALDILYHGFFGFLYGFIRSGLDRLVSFSLGIFWVRFFAIIELLRITCFGALVQRWADSSKFVLQEVEVVFAVQCERKAIVNQKVCYYFLFFESQTCRLSRALHTIKVQLTLVLILPYDLH
jgi:hypothetical protein